MQLRQVQYLAVPSGRNTNYYRVRVFAHTALGKADFRSGWFPAAAVDSLFGDVSEAGATKALKVRQEIQESLDQAYKSAIDAYLKAAQDPKSTPAQLQQLLAAVRAVRTFPGELTALPPGGVEIEYDPAASIVLAHAGEKLVFVLSSDPDEVIGVISNFAEQQKTGVEVLRLADALTQDSQNRVVVVEAQNASHDRLDALVYGEIQSTLDALAQQAGPAEVTQRLQALLSLIETVK